MALTTNNPNRSRLSTTLRILRWSLFIIWIAVMGRQLTKPMPPGTDIASRAIALHEEQVQFLFDITTRDARHHQIVEQHIFDALLNAIDKADRFVVLDFFLFNEDMGSVHGTLRPLSRELADRLLARKRIVPTLQVLLVTDPINDVYGGRPSPLLSELEGAGIAVVRTDLSRLRDSNPLYSSAWRMFVQWFGNSPGGALPDPFREQGTISARSWLSLLNFKANHRKVLVSDINGGEWQAIVTSMNPHDASGLHSNVAWRLEGEIAEDILKSELDVARFSGWSGVLDTGKRTPSTLSSTPTLQANYLTEQAIREMLIATIAQAQRGNRVYIATFYLSDRAVLSALVDAAQRGADVRLILDPNKDAFGIEKDGVPNRPVANELVERSNGRIQVRWYRTEGEQFHTKFALIEFGDQTNVNLGSANLTRRNIGNYNLEANVQIAMPSQAALARQSREYFERLWNDDESKHIEYTAPFGAYKDESSLKYWRYRFMEATGLSTF